jgi:hypothetical protein
MELVYIASSSRVLQQEPEREEPKTVVRPLPLLPSELNRGAQAHLLPNEEIPPQECPLLCCLSTETVRAQILQADLLPGSCQSSQPMHPPPSRNDHSK